MPGDSLRVAVIGDSAMWGQGLRSQDKFAVLAARRIAAASGRTLVVAISSARSGAKLVATDDRNRRRTVQLPSGTTRRVPSGDHYAFYDTFPAFFTTDAQALDFFAGRDESMADAIRPEVPSTFPTIEYQVARAGGRTAAAVDLVLIDGSVNDVGLRNVLDPEDGPSLDDIARAVRTFAFDRMKEVLGAARTTFPNAVMAVTGYYAPFSARTDLDRLYSLLKYMSDRPGWQKAFNDFINSPFSWLTPSVKLLDELLGLGVDPDDIARRAIRRAEFAHGQALYWLRRAVADLYESRDRGPGIFFVPSGFRPENSLFAGGTPFLHEGYRPPGDGSHVVRDALLGERVAAIPRGGQLTDLRQGRDLAGLLRFGPALPRDTREATVERLSRLRAGLDGPRSLRRQLALIVRQSGTKSASADTAVDLFDTEIARIETAVIASFLHPNEAGALRYVDRIVVRHARHQELRLRESLRGMGGPGVGTHEVRARRALLRYGLDAGAGLRAPLQHTVVDVLGVELEGDAEFGRPPFGPVPVPLSDVPLFLRVSAGHRYRLTGPFDGLSVADTYGDLRLGDISAIALEADDFFGVVRLRRFTLLVNGRRVFSSSKQSELGSMAFPYPVTAPA
ncbi:hypothetical protein HLK59_44415 [Streptomyces sp. S3(2020)]|uniref:hypothetical protein n=1 Tax=Streptomyces sp. S3(2020) TaxID=2732044 RepID=UPI001488912D|nr:hypothetical protein [Streptomyces sp. S3(2020)]NNN37263.1 hypothetical protein [Streptomyces sp. S3(2020)]